LGGKLIAPRKAENAGTGAAEPSHADSAEALSGARAAGRGAARIQGA